MGATMINRGRGPEIAGARIPVNDVVDYWQHGRAHVGDTGTTRCILLLTKRAASEKNRQHLRRQLVRTRDQNGISQLVMANRNTPDRQCQFHAHDFTFGVQELQALKIFLTPESPRSRVFRALHA
jgi:hypothetical protein